MSQDYILGIMFSVALLLAGSDGEWFPWPNFIGVGMLLVVAWWANRADEKSWIL